MNVNAPAPPFSGAMDVDEFMAFLQTQPHGEHWELIEGVAVMAGPAGYAHRRTTHNLCELLNGASRSLDLFAYFDAGVRSPGEIHAKRSNWQPIILRKPNEPIEMPEFGLLYSVADLYRRTPLEPRSAKTT